MQQGFDGKSDYQKRRELRREYERWLASIDTDYLVTLSFSQSTRIASARQMLRHWFARIDNHYIGRTWSRVGSAERTFGISFPENMQTNLHYHCLIRLPIRARAEPYEGTAATLQRTWYRVAPRGSCDVAAITDIVGAARYVVKQVVRPGYLDHYILASEFHSCRNANRSLSTDVDHYQPSVQARQPQIS